MKKKNSSLNLYGQRLPSLLFDTKIGIAGVGGIGSNVAQILVRSGVLNLKIVDFDIIETSNLDRQFYFASQVGKPKVDMLAQNLAQINPEIKVEKSSHRICHDNISSVFADCRVVVEGFDGKASKIMLTEALGVTNRLVVSASGVAGSDMSGVKIKKLGNNTYVAGDFCSDDQHVDIFPPKIFYIASIMAQIVLENGKRGL